MKNILKTSFLFTVVMLLFSTGVFSQGKPQQLNPASGPFYVAGEPVYVIADAAGNYQELQLISSECLGDDAILTYRNILTGSTIVSQTIDNLCIDEGEIFALNDSTIAHVSSKGDTSAVMLPILTLEDQIITDGNGSIIYVDADGGTNDTIAICDIIDDAGCLKPVALSDRLETELGELPIIINICDNDTGTDSPIVDVILKGPNTGAGTFTYNNDCTVTYSAAESGKDVIKYCVIDSDGDTSNIAEIIVDVRVESDLQVVKVLNEQTFMPFDTISYTITAVNNGPSNEPMAFVFDQLAADVIFVDAVASTGSYSEISELWQIGPMTVGQVETLTIRVQTFGLSVFNTALIDGDNADDNALNNIGIVSFSAPAAPEARVSMTNPDASTGVFDATWDFTQLANPVPDGECVSIDVILIDTLTGQEYVWETLTGLLGDNITTFTSTETTVNFSITDHSVGVIGHGQTTMTDKQSWAIASGNNGLNASKMIFEVTVGGQCAGNPASILPESVNLDNTGESCKIKNWSFENQQLISNIIGDIESTPYFFSPLGSTIGYATSSSSGIIPITANQDSTWRRSGFCSGDLISAASEGGNISWYISEIYSNSVFYSVNFPVIATTNPNGVIAAEYVRALKDGDFFNNFKSESRSDLINCTSMLAGNYVNVLLCEEETFEGFTMSNNIGGYIKYITKEQTQLNY